MVPADSRRISRVLRYSGVAWISSTGFAYGAVTLCGRASLRVRLPVKSITVGNPTTPGGALPRPRFGLFRFRSPLLAESLLFSLPAGTEMFQFPAFAQRIRAVTASLPPGFPIRTSAVHAGICPSPPLFAACHVLLRLREPQASPMRPSLLSFFLFAFFRPAAKSLLTRLLDSSVRLLFVFSYLFFSRLRLQRLCLVSDLLVHHVNDLSISLSRSPRQS